jgi:hypothetical protein
MERRPLVDEELRTPRELIFQNVSRLDADPCVMIGIARVKVRRAVIVEEHRYHDAREAAEVGIDDRRRR